MNVCVLYTGWPAKSSGTAVLVFIAQAQANLLKIFFYPIFGFD
jgi:hypothetical protein